MEKLKKLRRLLNVRTKNCWFARTTAAASGTRTTSRQLVDPPCFPCCCTDRTAPVGRPAGRPEAPATQVDPASYQLLLGSSTGGRRRRHQMHAPGSVGTKRAQEPDLLSLPFLPSSLSRSNKSHTLAPFKGERESSTGSQVSEWRGREKEGPRGTKHYAPATCRM